jgi:hypothetical protein
MRVGLAPLDPPYGLAMWYRIFGSNDTEPTPAAVLEHLNALGAPVSGQFHGEGGDWFGAELLVAGKVRLGLERFLASEEGIRAELNSWAAWLETCAPQAEQARLMECMIQVRQLFTLQRPDEAEEAGPVCVTLCQFLAQVTDGTYQIDGRGLFAADGTLLVEES